MSFFKPLQLSERVLLLLLAAVQFTHIMDFMIMMPLSTQLMRQLSINPEQFGWLLSSYTWSSGIAGLVATLYVDRFDRRPLLLVVYAGFILGTLACALSHSYWQLMAARIISGGFGGVSAALVMTIVTDVVPPIRRAAGIGIVMTAFSVASGVGVPAGLFLADRYNWESPFIFIAAAAVPMWVVALLGVPSLRGHVSAGEAAGKWRVLISLVGNRNVQWALLFSVCMIAAHFTVIPMLATYLVYNVGLPEKSLFLVWLTGGALTVFTGPLAGKWADRFGRWRIYTLMTLVASLVIVILTNAPPLPQSLVLVLAGFFFVFASGRFGPGQAITSLAVAPAQRGAFMSFSSCIRDLMMGIISVGGGLIVHRVDEHAPLEGYNLLGWIAVICGLISLWVARRVREVG